MSRMRSSERESSRGLYLRYVLATRVELCIVYYACCTVQMLITCATRRVLIRAPRRASSLAEERRDSLAAPARCGC